MNTCLRLGFVVSTAVLFCLQKAGAQNTSPYWSLAGNSNATTSSKLGTTNNIPLKLYTYNKERLRIDTFGRVLIGTTTATSRLSVNAATGISPFIAQVNGSTKLFVSSGGGVSIGSGTTAPANGLYVAGTIGVGTATPTSGYKLHVVGKGLFTTGLTVSNGDVSVTNPTGQAMIVKGNTGGIKVRSVDESLGYPVGTGIGVESLGGIGIKGSGSYGVQGFGSNEGTNIGVYGYGENDGTGVKGESPDGTGMFAKGGSTGIDVQGGNVGVSATGFFAVVGSGDIYGVQGYASAPDGYGGEFSSKGSGLHASAGSTAGSYAAVFSGNVYASGIFQSSDKNLKQNVQEFSDAMSIISKLKPRNYEFKTDAKLAALHLPAGTHYGLIAQDVAEVLPNVVADVRNNVTPLTAQDFNTKDSSGKIMTERVAQLKKKVSAAEILTTKAVNYTELIPIIIKGMQEQEAEIKAKDEKIADLEARLNKLEAMVMNSNNSVTSISSAYLKQNTPNPVNGTTSIGYNIPETSTSARIILTNAEGQVIKTINLPNKGTNWVNLNTSMLAAGAYNYTLYVDERQVDTKRLVIAK